MVSFTYTEHFDMENAEKAAQNTDEASILEFVWSVLTVGRMYKKNFFHGALEFVRHVCSIMLSVYKSG